MSSTVAVRIRSGAIGESQRQAHLATEPATGDTPAFWSTYCGVRIPAEIAEVSNGPTGMPCMVCMMRSLNQPGIESGL